jgi:Crinkler effector protein N-terminal domain
MPSHQEESYTIFCVIVGQNKPFSIEIESSKTVDTLKKVIKEEAQISTPAHQLDLYHVEIPDGKDLAKAVEKKMLEHPAELMPRKKLAVVFKDGLKEETLIIVQPPESGK